MPADCWVSKPELSPVLTNRDDPLTKLTQPLKWHGGKHYLAQRIIAQFPPHLHYVEPYFGGGSVLLARDPTRDWLIDDAWKARHGEKIPARLRGCSEVVNDSNGWLMNFWKHLRDGHLFEEFQRRVTGTPFSQAAFDEACDTMDRMRCDPGSTNSDAALAFFIRCRQSRQGLGTVFATMTRKRTRGSVNEQANAYWGVIDGLPEVHQRLRNVVMLDSGDALQVIKQQDGPHTLFYLDPPYLHETRVTTNDYENEMTKAQHFGLLELLVSIEGKFILSGYHSAMYDDHAERFGWRCLEIQIDNKASRKATKETKTECLWMNYQPGT